MFPETWPDGPEYLAEKHMIPLVAQIFETGARALRAALLLWALPLLAEDGSLTLEKLFHPTRRVAYINSPASYAWLSDGSLLVNSLGTMARFPSHGRAKVVCKGPNLTRAFIQAGFSPSFAKRLTQQARFTPSPQGDEFIAEIRKDYYRVQVSKYKVSRLTFDRQVNGAPQFSPDGKHLAYIKKNNPYVMDMASGREIRLTNNGSDTILNGFLDWVYEEEIYGRGNSSGLWWSPDSKRIACLSLDIANIPTHTLLDERKKQRQIALRYPRAGEPAGKASLSILTVDGHREFMEDPYPGLETLIVHVGWDGQGRLTAAYQDRIQSWVELRRFENGKSRLLLRESSAAWQDRLAYPYFLKDGRFLWQSDKSGRRHIYLMAQDGQVIRPVTTGEWDVRELHGVDEQKSLIYFSGTERSPIGLDAYAVKLEGSSPNAGLRRLTESPGYHAIWFNPTKSNFLDRYGDINTPMRIDFCDADGKILRQMEDMNTKAFRSLTLGKVSFQQVPARDGFMMETMLVIPPDLQPTKKYPVFHEIYGAPQIQSVRNAKPNLWHHFLAQHGYIVWVCDPRSSSNKGIATAHTVHGKLGQQELQDQLDGLVWLEKQGFADMKRIAIEGWSYGGFLAGSAITRSKAWKMAILGAPVTDFRLYDSVYTERYMGLPNQNKEGYLDTNLSRFARDASGPILIFHGTLDDNVLPQNTIRFVNALQNAGKDHELVLLPGSRHGTGSLEQTWFRYLKTWAFLEKHRH